MANYRGQPRPKAAMAHTLESGAPQSHLKQNPAQRARRSLNPIGKQVPAMGQVSFSATRSIFLDVVLHALLR